MAPPLASITSFIEQNSTWALLLMFALLTLQSFGIPAPGETALIACAILASQGALSIVSVTLVGILAAVIGATLGYATARKGGRPLLERLPPTRRYALPYLPLGERFFHKHGGKAVFLSRWASALRVASPLVAGVSHMPWRPFIAWNTAGGIVWATAIALIAYYAGDAAASAISKYGLYAAIGGILLAAVGFLVMRRLQKRLVRE
jgi:membrane protein DedA with SNARE-associated domain